MSKRIGWILAAGALAVVLAVSLSGLALSMGMGTGGGMHRGGGMGPGMMGGGMMGGRTWGGSAPYDHGRSGDGPIVRDRTGNPVAETPESIARGRTAYQQRCVACHGAQGRGDGLAAASLPRPPADLQALSGRRPDQQLYTTLTYGWGAMPGFAGSLSETQRWDVVNYLQHLRSEDPQR